MRERRSRARGFLLPYWLFVAVLTTTSINQAEACEGIIGMVTNFVPHFVAAGRIGNNRLVPGHAFGTHEVSLLSPSGRPWQCHEIAQFVWSSGVSVLFVTIGEVAIPDNSRSPEKNAGSTVIPLVQWTSATNRTYSVWRSTTLMNGAAGFERIAEGIAATPPYNIFTDTTATGPAHTITEFRQAGDSRPRRHTANHKRAFCI